MPTIRTAERILIFRLSSLGDVILASTALTHLKAVNLGASVDWVIAAEYSDLLKTDPRIKTLWQFDRKAGLGAWLKLCRVLFQQDYDLVLDLHSSLRTRIARVFFAYRSLLRRKRIAWRVAPKQRFRLLGYFVFKNSWPRAWRPKSWIRRINRLLGEEISAVPNLTHLIADGLNPAQLGEKKYYCVMPSSVWKTKSWSVESFAKVLKSVAPSGLLPVILGTSRDTSSTALIKKLEDFRIPHLSGVGKWSLPEVARVLAGAEFYLGNDTGLGHLAEAVGTHSLVIFGPTVPEMGFSPWRPDSQAIGANLWCRPCSKDGRACHRLGKNRHSCLSRIYPEIVASIVLGEAGKAREARLP